MAPRSRIVVVFVLSAPRSGSTWLNLVLGSNSWAVNLGEYFRPFMIPGHVACRFCEAEGLSECTELHGIEHVAVPEAFHFAADRLHTSVLIDASKRLDWCERFLRQDDMEVKLIHLVRNPCGFIESEGRRRPDLTPDQLLTEWETLNREIESFAAASGKAHMLACYDDLADKPDAHFPRLCDFIGHAWEPEAIQYWLVPHHGLGGNGAASLYLRDRKTENYITGDDPFYAGLSERPVIADRRWIERLPYQFCESALASPYAVYLQKRLGSDWHRLLSKQATA